MALEHRLLQVGDINPDVEDYVERLDRGYEAWDTRLLDLTTEAARFFESTNTDFQKYLENAFAHMPGVRVVGDKIVTFNTGVQTSREFVRTNAQVRAAQDASNRSIRRKYAEIDELIAEGVEQRHRFLEALVSTTEMRYLREPSINLGTQSKALMYLELGDKIYTGIAFVGNEEPAQVPSFSRDRTLLPGELGKYPSDSLVFPDAHNLGINCYVHFLNTSRVLQTLEPEQLIEVCAAYLGQDVDQRTERDISQIPVDKRLESGFKLYHAR